MPERQREVTLRFLAEPTDINFGGKVHGGTVMKWIDQAGYACAVGWSGQYCVTVYVGGIRFYKPIHIGHMVEVRARLIYTGRTSMHVAVDVSASDPRGGEMLQTTHCIIIFVAVDDAGKPVEVSPWVAESEEDQRLAAYAIRLMELRQSIEDQMREHLPGT
jgi:acyl-CoA hydrolase